MSCTHRWILETPSGPDTAARCRLCGEERSFPTTLPDRKGMRSILNQRAQAKAHGSSSPTQ